MTIFQNKETSLNDNKDSMVVNILIDLTETDFLNCKVFYKSFGKSLSIMSASLMVEYCRTKYILGKFLNQNFYIQIMIWVVM